MPRPRVERGQVWLTDLGLAAKVRPCLVLSVPFTDVERALVTLVPHTTKPRDTRFEVTIQARFLKPGAFDAQGLVTVPSVKLIKVLGHLTPEQLQQVAQGVAKVAGS